MSEHMDSPPLHHEMGFVDLLLFVVLTNFGIMWLPKAGEAGPAGINLWVIAAFVFYLPLALCVIILPSRSLGEGGHSVSSQRSFVHFAGFMSVLAYRVSILMILPIVLYFIAGSAL